MPPQALLTERLRLHAQRTPQRLAYTFLRDDGKIDEVRYQELEQRALRLAAALLQRAEPGARAVLLYPAGLEFITVFFACLFAGIIAVPATVPHRTKASRRLQALLEDADPALILTCNDCEPVIKASLSLVDAANRACLTTDAMPLPETAPPLPDIRPGMTALLQYTSGSTSQPKGVEITHGNIAANVEMIRDAFGFHQQSVMVSWLPLFHDMGLIGSVASPMHVGFHCVLLAPATFLKNPVVWLDAISTYRGTCAGAPNFGWDYCSRKISDEQKERLDLASLVTAYNGSEPIRAATLRRFHQAFERCGLKENALFPCYGMAETTLFVAGGPAARSPLISTVSKSLLEGNQVRDALPGSDDAREVVSSGRVARGTRVVIVDPETALPVARHRVGEVWVAGDSVAKGYWNRPAESAAAFGARLADSGQGPFLRTGDLAFLRDGELFVTGRLKDLIIINGRNVYPQDIEDVIEHAIDFIEPNMCAAFSVEANGQERLAIVAEANRSLVRAAQREAREGDAGHAADSYLGRIEATAHDICKLIAQQFDVSVSSIVFVKPGTFPRTTSGKVQRGRCKEMALHGQLDVVYVMPGSLFDRRGTRDAAAPPQAPVIRLEAPAARPVEARAPAFDAAQSRADADAMIAWLRQYAARRLNSRLMDERRTIPPYVVLDLGNQGFFGLQVPRRFGGRALATVDLVRVMAQLAAVDLTLATLVGVHNGLGIRPILRHAPAAMQERLLPPLAAGRQLAAFALTEPGAGSNPLALRATAVRVDGGWRVTAEKQWTGLGSWAGILTVFAKAQGPDGEALGVIALTVPEDTPGLRQGPEAPTMGMRGIVQNTVYLDAAFVPDAAVLLAPGEGMLVAHDAMMFSRLGIGAMCVGGMKRCAQLIARYAANRQVATGRLADNPVTAVKMQSLVAAIFSVEALVDAIAASIDDGDHVAVDYLACKAAASELLGEAADQLVQVLGGRGYIESNIAPQILRDARVLRILEGPSETLYMRLGAVLAMPDSAVTAFLVRRLGQPQWAAELAAAVAEIDGAARRGEGLFSDEVRVTQWLEYRKGQLAAAALLGAAAAQRLAAGGATETAARAVAWSRQRFAALHREIMEQMAERVPCASTAALLAQIDSYADAIGDIEQQLPGEAQQLDPALRLLQRIPDASSPRPPLSPVAAAAATGAAGQDETRRLVHAVVLDWLRSEGRDTVEDVGFDTPFLSLGMDSLGAVTVALELERRFAMPIVPELLYDYPTIDALAAYIDVQATPSRQCSSGT